MSLINQMLRDLQERQGDEASTERHAVPPATRARQRSLPFVLLIAGAGGALLLWWLAGQMTAWLPSSPKVVNAPAGAGPAPVVAVQQTEPVPPPKVKPVLLRPETLPGGVSAGQAPVGGLGVYQTAAEAFQAAQVFYRDNRESSAVAALQICLELDPQQFAARAFLADLYEMAGHFDAAILVLRDGVTLAPEHVVFKQRAAALMVEQGDLPGAVNLLLQSGLPRIGQAPEIHALLAGYYLQLDESFLAAQTYRNLLAAWPKAGAFWVGLGRALEKQGLLDDARKAYLQALAAGDLSDSLTQFVSQRLQAG